MPELPRVSGREAVRAFQAAGWEVARQRGSHVILTKAGSIMTLSVPLHDELGPGLLRALLRKADLSVAEWRRLLK
jgi:predicted RNA binding protein YcfA (HicA-like mRNA interferase family)